MGYHMMEYMGRLARKTGVAVLVALVMLVLMGQAQSRRNMAAARDLQTEVGPWSEEFSVTFDGDALRLGTQSGAFPWDTDMDMERVDFWRSGGFGFFEITCRDGSVLSGIRREGTADTSDGVLLEIRTENPDWKTWRGAAVGMDLQDVLSLYPEASAAYDAHREPGAYRYTYDSVKGGDSGFSRIAFTFQDGVLSSIDVSHVNG